MRLRRDRYSLHLPLFATMQGRPLKNSYLKTVLPKLARQAGIEKRVHPHGLRHTHASEAPPPALDGPPPPTSLRSWERTMEGVELGIIQRQLDSATRLREEGRGWIHVFVVFGFPGLGN